MVAGSPGRSDDPASMSRDLPEAERYAAGMSRTITDGWSGRDRPGGRGDRRETAAGCTRRHPELVGAGAVLRERPERLAVRVGGGRTDLGVRRLTGTLAPDGERLARERPAVAGVGQVAVEPERGALGDAALRAQRQLPG